MNTLVMVMKRRSWREFLAFGTTARNGIFKMMVKQGRPQALKSTTVEVPCPCGRIYVHVSFNQDEKPFEVFARLGKSGGCGAAVTSAITVTASIALRSGTDPLDIAQGLIGTSCHRPTVLDGERKITSCADAIGLGHELVNSLDSTGRN